MFKSARCLLKKENEENCGKAEDVKMKTSCKLQKEKERRLKIAQISLDKKKVKLTADT